METIKSTVLFVDFNISMALKFHDPKCQPKAAMIPASSKGSSNQNS